jgi:hypothetical protein
MYKNERRFRDAIMPDVVTDGTIHGGTVPYVYKTVVIPRWYEGSLDGRSTEGLSNRPPVLNRLSAKAFQKKTAVGRFFLSLFLGSFNYYS